MAYDNTAPKGYVSLWERQGGVVVLSGRINIKPEDLQAIVKEMGVNAAGYVEFDITLFENNRPGNSSHPAQLTGYVKAVPSEYRKTGTPKPKKAPKPELDDDGFELAF